MVILHISWLQLSGKIIFFFRKYDVTPRRKMKENISQKKYTEIWYLLQIYWKYGLFKKDCAGTWNFFTFWKGGIFFSRKHGIFSLDEKRERGDLSQEIYGNMTFSNWYAPLQKKKNQRRSYPAKIHLKVIGILDWHPRKSSSNFLYLHGDL